MGKTCNGCGTKPIEMATVTMSAAAWELHEQRHSREKMGLCVVIVLLVLAFIISNAAWLIYESQFVEMDMEEYYEISQKAEDNGENNAIIGDGRIINHGNDAER